MPPRPKRPEGSYWLPISTAGLVALLIGGGWLMLLLATDDDGFIPIVDSFNLIVHEAGHPLFGVFGEWPQWWGGTWMELLVPAVIAFVFWWQRSALSLAFAGLWFFENFHYIAWYMADARTQLLPLAGGGEHDWAALLTHYGLLQQDTAIAAVVNKIGWVGMIASLAFALGAWLIQRGAEDAQPAPLRATT